MTNNIRCLRGHQITCRLKDSVSFVVTPHIEIMVARLTCIEVYV